MNPIFKNPFRILGLPITAKEREIAKQINTLATYAEMGKTKSFDTDFYFLPDFERTPQSIEEAKKQIEQSESKLLYSLFWFWINNSVDDLALEVLKESNTNTAIILWEKSVFANKHKVYKPIVFIENLIRDSTNWSEEKDEDHSLTKNEDEYIVERKKETSYSIPTVFAELNYDDNWTIDCDTEWLSGVDDNWYGVIFGRSNSSFFSFQITGNGHFNCSKFFNWACTKLLDGEKNDAINKWSNNHIQIKKIEDKISFFINRIYVSSIQSEPFFGKYFGFKVTNNQKISFRNFKFCKLVEDKTYGEGINVTSKNFSCIKNLSTLYLSLATSNGMLQLDYLQKGIALAKSFFTSEIIEDYSKLIAGERYIYNSEKLLHFYINDIVDSLKNYLDKTEGISINQLINVFSSFPIEAKQILNNRFVSKQIQNIDKEIVIAEATIRNLADTDSDTSKTLVLNTKEDIDREIEKAQSAENNSSSNAIDTGKILVKNTKTDVTYLKNVLGEDDFQYQIIADKLSLAIVQCGVDAFNVNKDDRGEIDYVKAIKGEELYLPEYEFALSIACTLRAKERAQENLDSCKEYIAKKHLYNCWFCGNSTPDIDSTFTTHIYKVIHREYNSVNYSDLPIKIPRCSDCQKIHDRGSGKSAFIFFGCISIGILIGALMGGGMWFVGFVLGVTTGAIVSQNIEKNQKMKAGVKNTSESAIRNYPTIDKMLKEGWRFSKPEA